MNASALTPVAAKPEVPWSLGAYELGMTGFLQDPFHAHANSFWHEAADGRLVRLDFVTAGARDQYCTQPSDDDAVPCGRVTAQAGTPVARFFGASDRSADVVWNHDPLARAWFELLVSSPAAAPGTRRRAGLDQPPSPRRAPVIRSAP